MRLISAFFYFLLAMERIIKLPGNAKIKKKKKPKIQAFFKIFAFSGSLIIRSMAIQKINHTF